MITQEGALQLIDYLLSLGARGDDNETAIANETLAGLFDDYRAEIEAAAEQRVMERAALPERPDSDLTDILGRMCFQCINIADLLRVNGWEIKNRAEDEQAAVILFTLNHWIADKANWRDNADRELQAVADTIRNAKEA